MKKVYFFSLLVVSIGLGTIKIEAMDQAESAVEPWHEIFAPVQALAHSSSDEISGAFGDTFDRICAQVVREHDSRKSKRWLESSIFDSEIDRFLRQLKEAISEIQSTLVKAQIAILVPSNIYFEQVVKTRYDCACYTSSLYRELEEGQNFLREKRKVLLSLVNLAAITHQDPPYLHDVKLLQKTVDYENSSWATVMQWYTLFKRLWNGPSA